MRIPIWIDASDDECGYDCPFRTQNDNCTLFNAELDVIWVYGEKAKVFRCGSCMKMGNEPGA